MNKHSGPHPDTICPKCGSIMSIVTWTCSQCERRPSRPQAAADPFDEWLTKHFGKWIVARSNKKLRAAGYGSFFNRRTFIALERTFAMENEPVDHSPTMKLTEPDPDLAAKVRATPPGMAFWAGTGPQGKTCRECALWKADGYLAGSRMLKAAPCRKYESMMNGSTGPSLPHYTPSCKYFDPDPAPPAIARQRTMTAAGAQ